MRADHWRVFQTIVEHGSMVAAARELGLSTSTVSERLSSLESHYGVVLLRRTTRSLSLTEEGRLLFDGARRILAEVDDLERSVRHGASTLTGPIRISAPVDLGQSFLSTAIERFTADHPAMSIELSLSDGYVDVVRQGFDLAVRLGSLSDSSLRTRSLGQFRRVVCASPAYLARHGTPKVPEDLLQHTCLLMRFGTTIDDVWRFGKRAGREVRVHGDKVVNDGYLVRRWALAGLGIALKSEIDVASDLAAGRLVALLEAYAAPPVPLQLVFPPSRAQARRVVAFSDALASELERWLSAEA
ncbi:MAG: LysR family transcriptional regulator [Myxococcota bacterium]